MCYRFFTKYAWVTPLNDKKGKTVLKVFMEIVNEFNPLNQANRKPNKL